MPVLLAIEASPRGAHSVSRRLTENFIAHWRAAHPDGEVLRRDLVEAPPPFIDEVWLGANRTPLDERTPAMTAAMRLSDVLIGEVMAADHIVVGTPMINFAIPAVLKAYVDQIVRIGATITPQFEGLLRAKTATAIIASGVTYGPDSPWHARDSASPYLKQILNFLGIGEVALVRAEGTLAVDRGEMELADFAARFEGRLAQAARH